MAVIIVDLASCFQYLNPSNDDLVIKETIQNYVSLIGKKVCNLNAEVNTQANLITGLAKRVGVLENKSIPTFTIPSLYPSGIANPNILLTITEFVALLEEEFVAERSATGETDAIYTAIVQQPFNSEKALGTHGGNVSSLPSWENNPTNMALSLNNAWVLIKDLRSAIRNIQLNCCNSSCASIAIELQTNYSANTLTLYFTGTIPDALVNCVSGGSLFKISDTSGNYANFQVDVKANLNGSGIALDLSSSALNMADDLTVTSIYCLNDPIKESVCNIYISAEVTNNSACPTITVGTGTDYVNYQFNHLTGTLVYSVQLYDSLGTMVQSQNRSVSGATSVSGTFSSLSENTVYKLRVQMITETATRTCPFTSITTLTSPCPVPTDVTATLEY